MARLYLASTSPRRAELLNQIGVDFTACGVSVDETPFLGESAAVYVERLARAKAQAGLSSLSCSKDCVLGADTTISLEGTILGKPAHRDDGLAMLHRLSGRVHQVITAVAVADMQRCLVRVVTTEVRFRPLSPTEIEAYWATGEPCDKAGAYGIQGLAAVFVQHIQGSYSAVVGLPLCETAQLLAAFGIPCWVRNEER